MTMGFFKPFALSLLYFSIFSLVHSVPESPSDLRRICAWFQAILVASWVAYKPESLVTGIGVATTVYFN